MAKIGPCCLTGHIHEGKPEGKDVQFGGLDAYSAGNTGDATVIFFTDIFGHHLNNVRLLADEFANLGGFRVIVPDFFDKNPIPVDLQESITPLKGHGMSEDEAGAKKQHAFGIVGPWLGEQTEEKLQPRLDKVIAQAKQESKKVGIVGFCFGGLYAIKSADSGAVDAVVANHPSFVGVDLFKKVTVPTLVQAPGEDELFPADHQKEVEADYGKRSDAELIILPEATHGFACRGDLKNDKERKIKDEATERAITFFQKHLA